MTFNPVLNRAKQDLAAIKESLNAIGPRDLERAYDRGQHKPSDGFPGGGDAPATSGGDISDPTARRAVANICDRPRRDDVGSALREAFTALHRMEELARVVIGAFELTTYVHEQASKRQVPAGQGDCEVCATFCSGAQDDRLKSGFCKACYDAWWRYVASNPGGDRRRFLVERRAYLDAKDEESKSA